MLRFFALAICMALSPLGAGASVWQYTLTNNSPIVCPANNGYCTTGLVSHYQFSLDESLYPGGSIAGTTLRLSPQSVTDFESYTVTTSSGTFANVSSQSNFNDRYSWTNWFDYTKQPLIPQSVGFDDLFALFSAATFFEISFDSNRQVSSWGYFGETGGGSDYGGGTGRLEVIGGGVHSVNSGWQVTPPAHAPLPAAGVLMGFALGAMAWLRRRRTA